MFDKIKNILKIVFVIIGTLVGAGFASGKEIYSFFFVYGQFGVLGILVSSLIIGITIYKVLQICCNQNINTYHDFCKGIGSGNSSWFLNTIVNIFLLIAYYVMIAGFSGFMRQEFNVNGFVASGIIVVVCYYIFLKNVNGLIKISNFLIPVLIVFIIYISMKFGSINNINLTNKYIENNRSNNDGNN